MTASVTKSNLAPLASSESLDKMSPKLTIEQPWTRPDWAGRPMEEKTLNIYQVCCFNLRNYIVSPSPSPFPLDFGFWTWILDLDFGLDLGLTIFVFYSD